MRWCWIIPLLLQTGLAAQDPAASVHLLGGTPLDHPLGLDDLAEGRLFRIDPRQWQEIIRQAEVSDTFLLVLGEMRLLLFLEPLNRYNPESRIALKTEAGIQHLPARTNASWAGQFIAPEGGGLRLTLTPNHLSGGFTWQDETWLLEPLWYRVPGADRNLVLLYRDTHLLHQHGTCLALNAPSSPPGDLPPLDSLWQDERAIACKLVDYSAATDWAFFQKYGSTDEVIHRLETIMGLVELQYTGIFNHDYQFPFLELFISACPTCDPPAWTGITDAGALLGNFRDWAQAGGFALSYFDVSSLWTGRTLDANVLGAAYIQGVCNGPFRYQVLSDFSTNNSLMRAMVSHEFGHSFAAVHDAGDGFIMSTPLNNTTQWSAASIQAINTFTQSRHCLSNCYNDPPPLAQFEGNPRSGCAPLQVPFTDQSLNNPSAWAWSFAGASPASSNLQNPTVTYANRGSFTVSLTASNPFGQHTHTEVQYIQLEDIPLTGFDQVTDGRKVWFTNNTLYSLSYLWDFGDGQQSQAQHPEHTYLADGTFVVTLVAENPCGQQTATRVLTITTPPQAGFSADTLWGCPPLRVRFMDDSSPNSHSRQWHFPGGQPDTSSLLNPEVLYLTAGEFEVRLVVANSAGTDTLIRQAFIRVLALPDSVFHFWQKADSIQVAWPGEADSLRWDFGDGTFATDSAVSYRYANEGIFALTLRIWTPCGEFLLPREVTALRVPVAAWEVDPATGCVPLTVRYNDQSSGLFHEAEWLFPGGNPSSAEGPQAEVAYTLTGWYPAGLIVWNAAGADTLWQDSLIQVVDKPIAAFTYDAEILTVHLESQSPEVPEHWWDFGDGETGSGPQVSHTYSLEGAYTIRYLAVNDCGADSLDAEVSLFLSSQHQASDRRPLHLWPNPARDIIHIAPIQGAAHYHWYGLDGRSLARGWAQAEGGILTLPLPLEHNGWYILQLVSETASHVFRVFRG